MAQALTRDFERRLREAGRKSGLDESDVLNQALELFNMALAADHVFLQTQETQQEVIVKPKR